MSDKELIKICLAEVSRKSGYPDPGSLRQRDLEHLSAAIEKATGTLISISTIKRLLNGQFNNLPQVATLNAVAAYLGYESWQELRKAKMPETIPAEQADLVQEHQPPTPAKRRRSPWVVVAVVLVLLFMIVASLTYFSRSDTRNEKDISFTVKKVTNNDIPNTVVFSYDIDKIKGDSFFIQQSWDRDRKVRIEKNKHTLTDIYYEPGYHNAKLIVDNKVVKTIDVRIPTKDWFFFSKPGLFKGLPSYINVAAPVKNGVLSLTSEDIMNSKVDPAQQNFYYYTLFPEKCDVSSDNFSLKTRILFKEINNVACPMIVHEVCGQSNSLCFYTTLPGCTGDINLNVGEHFLSGKTTDLSGFGGDIRQWQDVEVIVKNKEASFYINGQKVYSKAYVKSDGLITGLAFMSNGLCEIDHIELKGLDGKLVYENSFNN